MTRVWVIGGGGHAKVAISTLQAAGWTVDSVFDDDEAVWGSEILGVPVAGAIPDAEWWSREDRSGFQAIGSNAVRKRMLDRARPGEWVTAIHPSATVHASARIGAGTLICAHAVVQPDAEVGQHAIVNTGAIVEHDCVVGDFCHLGPGVCLAGGVRVEEGAFLGMRTTAIPGVKVGAWSVVGAGTVLVSDVPAQATAYGVPGRIADQGA